MFKKLILSFTTVALAIASAATYNVTLYQDSKLNGKTLKPGEYRLEVKDNAVVLKNKKDVTEAAARTETNAKKFSGTSVLYNDKDEVTEIRLGGTTTKVILTTDNNARGGN
ncbi:MAG: hypothetical protein WBW33_34880 [Bryobacteraceae bacterium]